MELIKLGKSIFADKKSSVHIFKYAFKPSTLAQKQEGILNFNETTKKFDLDFDEKLRFSAAPTEKSMEFALVWSEDDQEWVLEQIDTFLLWQHNRNASTYNSSKLEKLNNTSLASELLKQQSSDIELDLDDAIDNAFEDL